IEICPVVVDHEYPSAHQPLSRSRSVKMLPAPGVLSQVSSAPSNTASFWLRYKPSPAPSKRRVLDLSSCSKAWNSLDRSSAVMPIPLSIMFTSATQAPSHD